MIGIRSGLTVMIVAEAGRERDAVCTQRGGEAGVPWQNWANDTAGKSIKRLSGLRQRAADPTAPYRVASWIG
jgi:hypothetical protein